ARAQASPSGHAAAGAAAGMSAPSSVRFEGVTKAFGAVVAVREVSFLVQAGHLVTLLGPSGCGKTTTLRMIAGLELPTSGRILIGERDVTSLPATARDVAMVFQSYALFPHLSVVENVAYGLTVSGVRKAAAHARAEETLALVGLAGYGARLPSELSGGQQQRVAVARAVVLEPQVLLFDEPLSNLDAKLRRRVREDIRDLQQKLGITAVYVTHDQEEALAISDRVIVMNNAVVAQEGRPRELYEAPVDRFVADFIGDANIVAAEIVAVDGATADVRLGTVVHRLPGRGLPPGPALLAVRPEAILLSGDAAADGIGGEIAKASYLGSHVEYRVRSPIGELFVIDGRVDVVLPPGTPVGIRLADRGVALITRG
ncbi:MAG TPA: ABC transporter ATP-binding protein, partial [Geminicoccaceae bacterium]